MTVILPKKNEHWNIHRQFDLLVNPKILWCEYMIIRILKSTSSNVLNHANIEMSTPYRGIKWTHFSDYTIYPEHTAAPCNITTTVQLQDENRYHSAATMMFPTDSQPMNYTIYPKNYAQGSPFVIFCCD